MFLALLKWWPAEFTTNYVVYVPELQRYKEGRSNYRWPNSRAIFSQHCKLYCACYFPCANMNICLEKIYVVTPLKVHLWLKQQFLFCWSTVKRSWNSCNIFLFIFFLHGILELSFCLLLCCSLDSHMICHWWRNSCNWPYPRNMCAVSGRNKQQNPF